MTFVNKIQELRTEQLSWLLLIKEIFLRTFNSRVKSRMEFIDTVKYKAIEKGYIEIGLFLNSNDLEEYFKT